MLIALQGAVSQGVLWGIMVLGVFITFRLLDIPDMTCDGSFALGGCCDFYHQKSGWAGSYYGWSEENKRWRTAI